MKWFSCDVASYLWWWENVFTLVTAFFIGNGCIKRTVAGIISRSFGDETRLCWNQTHLFQVCLNVQIWDTNIILCVLLHHLFLIWGITSWWNSGIKLSYCISLQLCYLKLLVNLNVVHSHCFSCIFVYSLITRHVLSLILFLSDLCVIIILKKLWYLW